MTEGSCTNKPCAQVPSPASSSLLGCRGKRQSWVLLWCCGRGGLWTGGFLKEKQDVLAGKSSNVAG